MEDKQCSHCGSKKYLVVGVTLVNDCEYERRLCCRKCETEWNERLPLDSGKNAYVYIWDSNEKKMVSLHRWVWEQYHHKLLSTVDDVHHINGKKGDNCPRNLECKNKYTHTRGFHMINKTNICKRCGHTWYPRKPVSLTCPKCRSPYWDKERQR